MGQSLQPIWRVAVFLLPTLSAVALADDLRGIAVPAVAQTFAQADRDGDKYLTLDEFLVDRGSAEIAKRDFRLFDLDGDAFLSAEEFSTVPTVIDADHRGGLPDPVIAYVDQFMRAMDTHWDDWDQEPGRLIPVGKFWREFAATVQNTGESLPLREIDPNHDLHVSREEARRFVEIQMGVRHRDETLLRQPTGCVVNYGLFVHVDLNRNGRIDRQEFRERAGAADNSERVFAAVDFNGDDYLSFDEWRRMPGLGIVDPIDEFRQLDANLDACVDERELMAGTPEWKQKLAANVFPAFDLDRDGVLNLAEYRLTMQANMVLPWHSVIIDPDGDGTLSLTEFRFDQTQFPLLRFVYFHRLDTNANGALDTEEFYFKARMADGVFILNADGTGWRRLFRMEGYRALGSPAVSPDGKLIAFHAWPDVRHDESALFVVNADGSNPRALRADTGMAMTPTWSKDGRFLACYRRNPASGVWILNADGGEGKYVRSAGGPRWSPDGSQIAFVEPFSIRSFNIETEALHTVIHVDFRPYRELYGPLGWSPDSRRLCFQGMTAEGIHEIATIDASEEKPTLKIHYASKTNINTGFAWQPSGDRIVFSMWCPEREHVQLYEFSPLSDDPPILVVGQDQTRNNTDVCWTPDGKQLIIVSGDFY